MFEKVYVQKRASGRESLAHHGVCCYTVCYLPDILHRPPRKEVTLLFHHRSSGLNSATIVLLAFFHPPHRHDCVEPERVCIEGEKGLTLPQRQPNIGWNVSLTSKQRLPLHTAPVSFIYYTTIMTNPRQQHAACTEGAFPFPPHSLYISDDQQMRTLS